MEHFKYKEGYCAGVHPEFFNGAGCPSGYI
jgi:hypothetical protein